MTFLIHLSLSSQDIKKATTQTSVKKMGMTNFSGKSSFHSFVWEGGGTSKNVGPSGRNNPDLVIPLMFINHLLDNFVFTFSCKQLRLIVMFTELLWQVALSCWRRLLPSGSALVLKQCGHLTVVLMLESELALETFILIIPCVTKLQIKLWPYVIYSLETQLLKIFIDTFVFRNFV